MSQLFGSDVDRMSVSSIHSRLSSTEAMLTCSEWVALCHQEEEHLC